MDTVLTAVAKLLEIAANLASDSTSVFFTYQPKKPDCMNKESENKKC